MLNVCVEICIELSCIKNNNNNFPKECVLKTKNKKFECFLNNIDI